MRFELPPHPKWRMAAACELPASFGYALWLVERRLGRPRRRIDDRIAAYLAGVLGVTAPRRTRRSGRVSPQPAAWISGWNVYFRSGDFCHWTVLECRDGCLPCRGSASGKPDGPELFMERDSGPEPAFADDRARFPDSSREPQPVRPTAASDPAPAVNPPNKQIRSSRRSLPEKAVPVVHRHSRKGHDVLRVRYGKDIQICSRRCKSDSIFTVSGWRSFGECRPCE